MVTFRFHTEFPRKAALINCCELKKLKILKADYCYICYYNVIGYYNAVSYGVIIHNEVCFVRFAYNGIYCIVEKYPNKYLQFSFFLLISHKNKWDLVSIARKGRSPCEQGLTSSASRGLITLVKQKEKRFLTFLIGFILSNSDFRT